MGAVVGAVIGVVISLALTQSKEKNVWSLIAVWAIVGAMMGVLNPWGGLFTLIIGGLVGAIAAALTDGLAATGEFRVIRSPGWLFWPLWVLAGALGWAIGFFITSRTLPGMPGMFLPLDIIRHVIYGLAIGMLQWLVLRRYVTGAAWWLLAWVLAAVVGGVLQNLFFSPNLQYILPHLAIAAFIGGVFGLGVGWMQWFFLRQWVRGAIWWIPAAIFAAALGDLLRDAIFTPYWSTNYRIAFMAVVTSGAIAEAITGLVLWGLLRYTMAKNKVGEPARAVLPESPANGV